MIKKKYFIETFGCQMNEFDSEKIRYILESMGYCKTLDVNNSDIIIINTCAVREKAKNKLYGHIGRLKTLKVKRPELIICVGGCSAQNLRDKIIEDFKFVDIVFGTHNISELIELIANVKKNKKSICSIKEEALDYSLDSAIRPKWFKAMVPISIGCNNFCSYCIVPYVRGREKSIEPKIILNNIEKLINEGVIEITLLGQNVNSYGKDFKIKYSFADLLENVSRLTELKRIRFMTSHPKDFTSDIIDTISQRDNICNHIHLPLQAGSDKILKLMNRKYDAASFIEIVENIRKKIPDCTISTDIIVGFPGEKIEDFEKTLEIVQKVRFNRAFTFIYSKREKTAASKMKDEIKIEEKKRWFNELLKTQNKISLEENKKLIGKKLKVLIEGMTNNGMLESRLDNNTVLILDKGRDLIGKIVTAEVKNAKSFYCEGEIIKSD